MFLYLSYDYNENVIKTSINTINLTAANQSLMFVILYGLKNVIAAATDKEKDYKETQECLNRNGSFHCDKISADQLNAAFFADAWYKPDDYSDNTLSVLYSKTAENKNLSASDEVCLYILASLYRSKKFKACNSKINETKKVFFQTVKTSSDTTEVEEINPIYPHTITKPGCSDGACEKGTSNATNGGQYNPFPSFIQNQAFLHVNRPHGIFNRFQAQLYFTVYTILEMEKHVKDSEKRELAQKIIERIECYLKNSHENYNFKNLKISYINKRFYLLYNDDTSFFVLKKIYEFGEKEEQPKTRVGKKRKSSKMHENEKREKVKKLENGEEEVWTKEYQTELTDYKILSMICDDSSDSIVNLDLICAFRENLISVIINSIIESRIQPFFKFDDTDRRFMQTLYLNAWLIHNEDFYGKLLALKDKEIDEMLSQDEPDKDNFLKNIPNYLSICGSE